MKMDDDDMLPEYDFAGQLSNSEAVNRALRELISPSPEMPMSFYYFVLIWLRKSDADFSAPYEYI